jgi:hypothetical protein
MAAEYSFVTSAPIYKIALCQNPEDQNLVKTNSLIPRNTVLQKLIVTHLIKKFLALYGTSRFIAVSAIARQHTLSKVTPS